MEDTPQTVEATRPWPGFLLSPIEVVVAALLTGGELATSVIRCSVPMVSALTSVVLDPPVLPRQLRPRRLLGSLAAAGPEQWEAARRDLARLLDRSVPGGVEQFLRRENVTRFLVQAADLDDVVAHMGLDATHSRLEVDALVRGLDAESRAGRAHVDTVRVHVDLDGAAGKADVDLAVLGLHALRLGGHEPRPPAAKQPSRVRP